MVSRHVYDVTRVIAVVNGSVKANDVCPVGILTIDERVTALTLAGWFASTHPLLWS